MKVNKKTKSWVFDREITDKFDKHISESIPPYYEIQKMILEISDYFCYDRSFVLDLGCSIGTTLKSLYKRHNDKTLIATGIDNSNDMIIKAKENLKDYEKHITLKCGDVNDFDFATNDLWALILCVLTLQFVPILVRQNILNVLYNSLHIGGAFIFVEKVLGEGNSSTDIFNSLYKDYKSQIGFTDKEILEKERSLRGVLMPLTLLENIEMLKKAGFKKIDIFFKWYNFVGIIAVK